MLKGKSFFSVNLSPTQSEKTLEFKMYVIILKKKKKEELKLVLKQLCYSYRGYSADRMGLA